MSKVYSTIDLAHLQESILEQAPSHSERHHRLIFNRELRAMNILQRQVRIERENTNRTGPHSFRNSRAGPRPRHPLPRITLVTVTEGGNVLLLKLQDLESCSNMTTATILLLVTTAFATTNLLSMILQSRLRPSEKNKKTMIWRTTAHRLHSFLLRFQLKAKIQNIRQFVTASIYSTLNLVKAQPTATNPTSNLKLSITTVRTLLSPQPRTRSASIPHSLATCLPQGSDTASTLGQCHQSCPKTDTAIVPHPETPRLLAHQRSKPMTTVL